MVLLDKYCMDWILCSTYFTILKQLKVTWKMPRKELMIQWRYTSLKDQLIQTRCVTSEDNQFMSKQQYHRINPSIYLFQYDLLHWSYVKWVLCMSQNNKQSNF